MGPGHKARVGGGGGQGEEVTVSRMCGGEGNRMGAGRRDGGWVGGDWGLGLVRRDPLHGNGPAITPRACTGIAGRLAETPSGKGGRKWAFCIWYPLAVGA